LRHFSIKPVLNARNLRKAEAFGRGIFVFSHAKKELSKNCQKSLDFHQENLYISTLFVPGVRFSSKRHYTPQSPLLFFNKKGKIMSQSFSPPAIKVWLINDKFAPSPSIHSPPPLFI